jgi:CheY-like chemotaxis protein
MTTRNVLIIDDEQEHIEVLANQVRACGGEPVIARHEAEARERLHAVARGEERYALAIIDVMMPINSLEAILELDDAVNEDSKCSGVRLCELACNELRIAPRPLEIVCFTIRDDEDVKAMIHRLGIDYYSKVTDFVGLRQRIRKALSG